MVDLEDTELPDFEALEEQGKLEEEAHMTLVNVIEQEEQVEGSFRILTGSSFTADMVTLEDTKLPDFEALEEQRRLEEEAHMTLSRYGESRGY